MATKDSKKKDEEGARSFARFIENVCDGDVHTELSTKLHELVQNLEKEAENRLSATGKLTLTLGIKIQNNGKAEIYYDVSTKEPKKERGTGTAWLTPGGNLQFINPRQQRLPLQDVSVNARIADDTTEEHSDRAVADV